MPAGSEWVLF